MGRDYIYPYLIASAISLEVSVYPKPGNVHRLADLPNMKFEDFILSSHIVVKWFLRGFKRGMRAKWGKTIFGDLIYYAIKDIIRYTGVNTSLGSLTLLIPLTINTGYCIANEKPLLDCIVESSRVLKPTTVYDSIYYYKAVRIARPSHLPRLSNNEYVDVWARDYARQLRIRRHRLVDVFEYSRQVEIVHDELLSGYKRSLKALNVLEENLKRQNNWNKSVVATYIYLLSRENDTLIVRKHGVEPAEYVRRKAREIYENLINGNPEWFRQVYEFDQELRRKKINPGSLADIICSTIALYLIKKHLEAETDLYINLFKPH